MKIMFLDESGDHNLSVIDPQYPLFVLGGIITDQEYAEGEMTEKLNRFKRDIFGMEDIILHTADITRNRNGFEGIKDVDFRTRFYRELEKLLGELNFKVVACAVRKDELLTRYGVAALDPYMMSLDILVERFCFEIGDQSDGGIVVAEKRGPTLDHELDLAWLNLKIKGTTFLKAKTIENRIISILSRHKNENISGLQIADQVVSPVGRFILGKRSIYPSFEVIERKFRRSAEGTYDGVGLVVLPKK